MNPKKLRTLSYEWDTERGRTRVMLRKPRVMEAARCTVTMGFWFRASGWDVIIDWPRPFGGAVNCARENPMDVSAEERQRVLWPLLLLALEITAEDLRGKEWSGCFVS